MSGFEYDELERIFTAAKDLEGEALGELLDRECRNDSALRREVEEFLRHGKDTIQVDAAATTDLDATGKRAPREVGPYRILKHLAEGGMGSVYHAEQMEPVRREVALKLIKAGMGTEECLARFEAERQALSLMNHPNIAKAFDAGSTGDGLPYFVMEYVPGVPLTAYCDMHRLDIPGRLDLFLQVCRGVEHAHQKGVIHRDLKPSNVLVQHQDGKPIPKIIDFGLAKAMQSRLTDRPFATEQGRMLGTPEYMSPEQAEVTGLNVDTRTDVYSLGVILYELLTGLLPFDPTELRAAGYAEIQRRLREDEPSKPSTKVSDVRGTELRIAAQRRVDIEVLVRRLKGDLDWITMKALAKNPTMRYQSVVELAADVERHQAMEPVLAGPPGVGYRLGKFVRRNRTAVATTIGIALALIVGLVSSTVLYLRAERLAAERLPAADLVRQERLLAEVELPGKHPANAAWLERAGALLERNPMHVAALETLRARGSRETAGKVALDNAVDQYRLDVLTRLVSGREARQLHERFKWMRFERAEKEREHAAEWSETCAAIAQDPRYSLSGFRPQRDLVPIGKDPDSGLYEFAHLRSGFPPKRDDAGKLQLDEESGLVFVLIPAGEFRIGAQDKDEKAPNYDPMAMLNEAPTTIVSLDAFFLSKYEMTRGQWMRLSYWDVDPTRSFKRGSDPAKPRIPVDSVSWTEVVAVLEPFGLALPTEAQWEYACRAPSPNTPAWPWWTGPDKRSLRPTGQHPAAANIADRPKGDSQPPYRTESWMQDGHQLAAPVNDLRANAFGLHHVLGNLFELCRDLGGAYEGATFRAGDGLRTSIRGVESDQRVIRGGAFDKMAHFCRVSSRRGFAPRAVGDTVTVRPSRPLDPR